MNTIGAQSGEVKGTEQWFRPRFLRSIVVRSASMGIEDCVTNVWRRPGYQRWMHYIPSEQTYQIKTSKDTSIYLRLFSNFVISYTCLWPSTLPTENSFSDGTRISEDTGLVHVVFYLIARVLRYFDKLTLLDPTDPPGRWRNTAPIDCGSLNKTIETLWYTISIYTHGGTGKFPIPVAISTGRLPLPPEKRLATG